MSATKRDYYEVLGVARTADKDEIKKAFRRLARQFHPDVNKAPEAEASFKEINEAYEVLSDDQRRAIYDRYGHAAANGQAGANPFEGMEGFPFGDIFETFFGGATTGRQAGGRRAQRGGDRRQTVVLDFREAVFGAEKEIEIEHYETCERCRGQRAEPGTSTEVCPNCRGAGEVRKVQQTILGQLVGVAPCGRCDGEGRIITTPCSACRGAGRTLRTRTRLVTIPAGVDDGTQMRLSGEGDAGVLGGPSGNLLVQLRVKADPVFRRDEETLYVDVPINIAQAALGAEIEVPTLEEPIRLKVPEGTQTGKVFKYRERGVPRLRGSGRGELIVTLTVATPTNLSVEQRQLFEQLAQTFQEDSAARSAGHEKGFFDKFKDALGFE